MFSNLSDLKKAGLFYVLVMALNVTQILIFRAAAPEAEIVVITHMMTPLLITLLMLFVFTRDGYGQHGRFGLGLRRLGWHSWGLALLLPLLVLAVSYGLAWLSGAATLVVPTDDGGLPNLLINLLPELVIVILLVLSEEIGFRGYLLPRLLGLGSKRAITLSGFLHAIWHLPIIYLTPFYLAEGSRFLTIPIFLLLLTAAGVIYGVLRLETESIWPSTILHGAFNAFLGVFTTLTVQSSPVAIYLVGESGVLTLLSTAVVALWLLQRRQTAVAPPAQMHPAAESVK
ncbi:MAG TPA: type II CAAX endopeptidase family protein [Chloroflexota bacterium]|nr:type II CAAX endopeptidase family protein [Chloroflexota bacterium]HUM67566.1 type II CAAX endopeptidase family protein [Chloroflexota bacterium]